MVRKQTSHDTPPLPRDMAYRPKNLDFPADFADRQGAKSARCASACYARGTTE
jgi:hypothetical protein